MSGLDTSQDVTTQEVFDNEHDHDDGPGPAADDVASTTGDAATETPGDEG